MEVGFTIKGGSVHKDNHKELVKFLVETHIMPTKSMADNIISAVEGGADVNIFGSRIDYIRVSRQKWDYSIIAVGSSERLVVSAIDSKIEISYQDKVFTLEPTGYMVVKAEDVPMFSKEMSLGIIRILPDTSLGEDNWILSAGTWNDEKIWADEQTWNY